MKTAEAGGSAQAAFVEYTVRVHIDGRRERFARLIIADADGQLRMGPSRPVGELGRFTERALAEALGLPRRDRGRRVAIDARDDEPARREGKRRRSA